MTDPWPENMPQQGGAQPPDVVPSPGLSPNAADPSADQPTRS